MCYLPRMTPEENILRRLNADPVLAHQVLFPHRHTEDMPAYHPRVIRDWHSTERVVVDLIFRGGAKSSIAEESVVTMACFRKFTNALILGENETRAKERLSAVKHEFETNEDLIEIFGNMRGDVWQETRIELTNGLVISAVGRGQSLRGVKHHQHRPDIAFCDDLEDEETVRTDVGRMKALQWFTKTLMPALTPNARIRMAATPLHPEALAMKVSRLPGALVHKIPIVSFDANGEEVSSWPSRYPLSWIHRQRDTYRDLGDMGTWLQEYLCEAEDEEARLFTQDMIKVEPRVRMFEPTFAVYDPARTVKSTSAMTGKVIGSWVNNRLVIWEAEGKFWKPDEIIEDMFKVDSRYSPTVIGVEEDGLHEFIMQPLRHAQVNSGHYLPIRALKAPKGKIDFIRSLQPFFKAGEVVFAGDRAQFHELEKQLLSFPTGRNDVPNALAYFLKLKPGQPIFEDFGAQHVVEGLKPLAGRALHLVLNATTTCTTAILLQVYDGVLSVLADFVGQGDPGAALPSMLRDVALVARNRYDPVAPAKHFQPYDVIGLRAAVTTARLTLAQGGSEVQGREQLRGLISRTHRGLPQLRVSPEATWTLRAMSGGYTRDDNRATPSDGVYKVLCEGLESFAALLAYGVDRREDDEIRWETDAHGRRYISARA